MQNGKIHNFGAELYGYRRNKDYGVREVYEPEARIVRALFHWYTEEKLSVRTIVKRLNEQEVPPPSISKGLCQDPDRRPYRGKGQIHRILREPAYKGLTISWRYDKVGRLKPEAEWLSLPEGVTPALVDRDLWEATQKQRASNTGAETHHQARPYLYGAWWCVRSVDVRCAQVLNRGDASSTAAPPGKRRGAHVAPNGRRLQLWSSGLGSRCVSFYGTPRSLRLSWNASGRRVLTRDCSLIRK